MLKSFNRRSFLQAGTVSLTAMVLPFPAERVDETPGQSVPTFPRNVSSVFPAYTDEKTGIRMFKLTPGEHDDQVIYQTHPMWTQGMTHLLFTSNRSGNGRALCLLDMATGEVRPLPVPSGAPATMTWYDNALYFIADENLHRIDVVKAFNGNVDATSVGTIAPECLQLQGGITADATRHHILYGGKLRGEMQWGIFAMDTTTGENQLLAQTSFPIGHLQSHPAKPRLLMFCHETGGDAPQRIWYWSADINKAAPLYKETYDEWVTHEVWWYGDRFLFTLWPYDEPRTRAPHGIAMAYVSSGPDGTMEVIAQYPAWHTHGSPDGKYVLGDDFDRTLWLINASTQERKCVTQGHSSETHKTHLHASFTPDSHGIVFTSSKYGVEDILYVPLPNWEDL